MAAIETERKPDNSEEMNTEEESKTQEQPDYPSFEGPGAKYVKLISSDKIEYILEKKYAQVSATLKKRLSETGSEEYECNMVELKEIPSHILDIVCKYMIHKVRYMNNPVEIPEFVIKPEIALELLAAANYLDC